MNWVRARARVRENNTYTVLKSEYVELSLEVPGQ